MSDATLYICVLIAAVLFFGDPDLHDALMENLNQQDSCTSLATEKGDDDE